MFDLIKGAELRNRICEGLVIAAFDAEQRYRTMGSLPIIKLLEDGSKIMSELNEAIKETEDTISSFDDMCQKYIDKCVSRDISEEDATELLTYVSSTMGALADRLGVVQETSALLEEALDSDDIPRTEDYFVHLNIVAETNSYILYVNHYINSVYHAFTTLNSYMDSINNAAEEPLKTTKKKTRKSPKTTKRKTKKKQMERKDD